MILTTLLACVCLTPIPLPAWRTRDAAPVISALGIQGDPSAACVHQLLDDFDADWGRLAAALDTELAWRDSMKRSRRGNTGHPSNLEATLDTHQIWLEKPLVVGEIDGWPTLTDMDRRQVCPQPGGPVGQFYVSS
ncbi:MAG: hypothetical protein QF471_03860 [Phycisphaerales bacterium]|jgi:hypothetical protein|nr:hypothetical protein [Phycisphaerales bacterium]